MLSQVNTRNVSGFHPLVPPRVVREQFENTPDITELVVQTRQQIRDVIHGTDERRHGHQVTAGAGGHPVCRSSSPAARVSSCT